MEAVEMVGTQKLSDADKVWMRELDSQGVPRREITRRLSSERGVEVTTPWVSIVLGPKMRRKAQARTTTINLSDEDLVKARGIARELGYYVATGEQAGQGNLSALLEGIARGEVEVKPRKGKR